VDRSQEQVGSDYYETPPEIFGPLNVEFKFTIDVCASHWTAKVPRYYTSSDDGLTQSWAGETVWCNPPYSNVGKWVRKAWQESQKPGTTIAMILWARTDSSWCESYVFEDEREWISADQRRTHNAAEVRCPRGRVSFLLKGERQGSPMLPAMVVVFKYGHKGPPIIRGIPYAKGTAPLAKRVKKRVSSTLLL
jgi:site-specific DNA-methyltransferase (adenine-specific)